MPDVSTGRVGEEYIKELLISKGYKFVCSNFKSRFGEIDVIVRDDKYIVFVEVKTRKKGSLVGAFESITISKQKKIMRTAEYYLLKNPCKLQPRFDAAAVETDNGRIIAVDYLTDAFRVN